MESANRRSSFEFIWNKNGVPNALRFEPSQRHKRLNFNGLLAHRILLYTAIKIMDFRNGQKTIFDTRSATPVSGTRIGLVLIDSTFQKLTRLDSDEIVERFLE
jgi:hypothetical protein